MDTNEITLRMMGLLGGRAGDRAVWALLVTGRRAMRRALRAETAATEWERRHGDAQLELERERASLRLAQASIRAMVGQVAPEDPRIPIDPPAGHRWTTGVRDGVARSEAAGRLVCVVCTDRAHGGEHVVEPGSGVVLAAECLERAR